MNETIFQILQKLYDVQTDVVLTRPDAKFGDYATNVALQLAKPLGRNPREIAEEIAGELREAGEFSEVSVAGPGFINVRLSDRALLALAKKPAIASRQGQTVVIETNNPNPFKAMHIGHAMNSIVADGMANLLEESGATTHRVSYHGDIGAHVGKSMWAFLRYVDGDGSKLEQVSKTERNSLMNTMYAEGARAYKADDQAKSEIDELARQSFSREDPLYAAVYDTVFAWSFDGIAENLERLGNQPVERRFLESEADGRGVETVRAHVPDVFEESDGALVFRGSKYGAFDNAFVASSGRGLYAARDLGLMQLKNEAYHPNKSFIVTAEEQRDYFKGVIAAAGLCLPELAEQTLNVSTGMVKLSTGKMSSRSGDVVTISWLFDQIASAIRERGGDPTGEVVAGALRYAFLRVRIGGDIVFDINESVSIQGNSGPYLQYAHARACSILEKTAVAEDFTATDVTYDEAERLLLRKIGEYHEAKEVAMRELLPHHICNYLYELAQEFNRFYEKSRVIGDEREAIRIELVRLYRDTLAAGLNVLGIAAPEKL